MVELKVKKLLRSAEGDMELNLEFALEDGDFISIFGESGAGKSTLLRMLAGLLRPDEGYIRVDGKSWFDSKEGRDLPPQKRRIGFVFQDYALFPNMTIEENLRFALRKGDSQEMVEELIETVGLGVLRERYPSQLSGGQKQRVALARALVQRPRVLLLDEPLSALDRKMRSKLQDELAALHKKYSLTIILVSHDPSEVFRLCNKVYHLQSGKVIKSGTPSEVFLKERIGSSFKFTAEVLEIERCEMLYLLTLSVGNQIVKVMASKSEIEGIKAGDRVQAVSKSFHPMIFKIEH